MQLVRATETFAPQSTHRFTPNGSHLLNKKRKKTCTRKENIPSNITHTACGSCGTHTDEKKQMKKVKIIDEIFAAERLDIEDEGEDEDESESERGSELCVEGEAVDVMATVDSSTRLDPEAENWCSSSSRDSSGDSDVIQERGGGLLRCTSTDSYTFSSIHSDHDNNNNGLDSMSNSNDIDSSSSSDTADSNREGPGDCADSIDGNASDGASMSSLAMAVSIGGTVGGNTQHFSEISESITAYPISVAECSKASEGGTRTDSYVCIENSAVKPQQRIETEAPAVIVTGTVAGQYVEDRRTSEEGRERDLQTGHKIGEEASVQS